MNRGANGPTGIRRLADRIVHVASECYDATHRMTTLAGTPDRYLADPDRAPDTYAEFLLRMAGLAQRAPASREQWPGVRTGC
jgi:hypothetical protein